MKRLLIILSAIMCATIAWCQSSDSISSSIGKESKDPNYWKKALLKGKLDLHDTTVVYPSFVKFCVDTYNWGDHTFNYYDSAYVVGTGKKWKLIAKNDNWVDSYALHFPGETPITMLSNLSSNLGLHLSYMAVSVGYDINTSNIFGGKAVSHKKWEFQFTCSLVAAEAYYSHNTSGTNIRTFGDVKIGDFLKEEFPGLQLESYGLDAYYFFNHKRYAQGAAYNFSKYQKRSAGSWIAGITLSHQNIDLDFTNMPEKVTECLPDGQLKYRFIYNDYCFLLGYAYNWVFKKNWLFNISALPSIGMKHCFAESVEGTTNLFSTNVKGKMAVVHNHSRFFYGLLAKFDGHWYKSKDYSFFNSVESVSLNAGFRF